jgi:hypothetical protein
LAALAAVPTGASASGGCAPSLPRVKRFEGTASVVFTETASGVDPGEGGVETIKVFRGASDLHIDLPRFKAEKNGVDFPGTAIRGVADVEDRFANTGTGFTGSLSFSDPLTSHFPNSGIADLVIDRRKNKCKYEFQLFFGVKTTYSGDEELQPPLAVSGAGYSGRRHLPNTLKLSDTLALPVVSSCEKDGLIPFGCYEFSGGWTNDFYTLALCHSVGAVNCQEDTRPVEFHWSLHPILKKHHHKKKKKKK